MNLEEEILEVISEFEIEDAIVPAEPKIKNEYFKNSEVLPIYVAWREKVMTARANGTEEPSMPNSLGISILKLANKITSRPNFVGYSYRDMMVSDIVETIIRYALNFDPAKGSNLFGYFSMIAYNAAVNRIKIEQRQSHIKAALVQRLDLDSIISQSEFGDADVSQYIDSVRAMSTHDVSGYEEKIAEKKRKRTEQILSSDDIIPESGVMVFEE